MQYIESLHGILLVEQYKKHLCHILDIETLIIQAILDLMNQIPLM